MTAKYQDYYLPMDIETRKIYRQWLPSMIVSNTFLVVSDLFIQARTAALVSFNFLQIYPNSSVMIVNADKEKDGICAQLKAVGIALDNIFLIKDEKQFKKQSSAGVAGVYFVTTKTMSTLIAKDSLTNFDFKLMIICGAEKADSTSGLAKIVPYSFTAGKIFRVLALSFALPKKLAKVQSLTSNLQIHRTLIKKTSDTDIGEILFDKETSFIDVRYDSRELELMKLIITFYTKNLISLGITSATNLKSLFFMDTEIWLKGIPEDSEHRNIIEFTAVLIEGYKLLIQYGARALFLYFSSKSDVFGKVNEVAELKELHERLEVVNFGAYPNRDKRNELLCHPKLEELFKLVNINKPNQKFLVICSSPFGVRAVSEYLVAARIQCLENAHGFYDLMSGQPHLRGPEPFTPEEARREFLQRPIPVMVTTECVENLGLVIFEFSVSMDY
uniref:Uncharacterized protein n=1 Tax=Panagrolaimus sp. ES5 TaxID=591445 RepID=A0AC34FU23_9BILA